MGSLGSQPFQPTWLPHMVELKVSESPHGLLCPALGCSSGFFDCKEVFAAIDWLARLRKEPVVVLGFSCSKGGES